MFLISLSLCYISTTIIISISINIIIIVIITLMEPSLNLMWFTWHIELVISSFFPNVQECTKELNLNNMLSLSMDGPSVNWKFVELLQEEHREQFGTALHYK